MTTGIYKTAVLPNSMFIFPFEISTVFLYIKCTWNSFTTENLTVGKSTQEEKKKKRSTILINIYSHEHVYVL